MPTEMSSLDCQQLLGPCVQQTTGPQNGTVDGSLAPEAED